MKTDYNPTGYNYIGGLIAIVAALDLIGGIILAYSLGSNYYFNDLAPYVFAASFVSAIMLLGFSEVIRQLTIISSSLTGKERDDSKRDLPKL